MRWWCDVLVELAKMFWSDCYEARWDFRCPERFLNEQISDSISRFYFCSISSTAFTNLLSSSSLSLWFKMCLQGWERLPQLLAVISMIFFTGNNPFMAYDDEDRVQGWRKCLHLPLRAVYDRGLVRYFLQVLIDDECYFRDVCVSKHSGWVPQNKTRAHVSQPDRFCYQVLVPQRWDEMNSMWMWSGTRLSTMISDDLWCSLL